SSPLQLRYYSHGSNETDEEFDARWVTYFNKPDTDSLKIIDAALRACRRLNDFASTIRILEAVKDKAGPHKEIYPYVIQEPRPTFNKLGISTPEELGLDKSVNPMDGLPKDLLILLLECKQSPGNTDDNILSYLNKFSFIEYQAI
uniref:Cytochrome c oxidase subunit 5A, mitochondrial n=1 Tax=Aotus nancymaae TaxID=37293 RepID=A0A2K5E4D5_AOTNA